MGLQGIYTLKIEITMGYKQATELKQYLKQKYGFNAIIEKKKKRLKLDNTKRDAWTT